MHLEDTAERTMFVVSAPVGYGMILTGNCWRCCSTSTPNWQSNGYTDIVRLDRSEYTEVR